jgi:hypothetical protein
MASRVRLTKSDSVQDLPWLLHRHQVEMGKSPAANWIPPDEAGKDSVGLADQR